jgi:hypothetical protein
MRELGHFRPRAAIMINLTLCPKELEGVDIRDYLLLKLLAIRGEIDLKRLKTLLSRRGARIPRNGVGITTSRPVGTASITTAQGCPKRGLSPELYVNHVDYEDASQDPRVAS